MTGVALGAQSTRFCRIASACSLALFGSLFSGCSESTHGQHVAVRILDDTHLEISSTPCPDGPIKTTVRESAEGVLLSLTYDVRDGSKCTGMAKVQLAKPLAERSLVNSNTGLPFVVVEDLRCSPSVDLQRCDGVPVGTDPG